MIYENKPATPWYKQFWPYFLFFFPFVAVVAGIITFVIAQNNSPALVSGNYYKEGLAINADKALEAHSKKLGLVANVVVTPTTLTLKMSGLELDDLNLMVELEHPVFDDLDQSLMLLRIADNVYQVPVKGLQAGKWYVRIKGQNNTWEINQTAFVSAKEGST